MRRDDHLHHANAETTDAPAMTWAVHPPPCPSPARGEGTAWQCSEPSEAHKARPGLSLFPPPLRGRVREGGSNKLTPIGKRTSCTDCSAVSGLPRKRAAHAQSMLLTSTQPLPYLTYSSDFLRTRLCTACSS